MPFVTRRVEDVKTIRTLINMDMRRIQRVLIAKDGSSHPKKDEEPNSCKY